ncbi:MAG: glycosyltransferase family 2 protein [bacterium]
MTAAPNCLTVVVVTYDSADVLPGFLDSLEKATSSQLDVIVSDNGSTDRLVEAIGDRSFVTVLSNGENLGYGRAVNAGVAKASGEFVLIANPDLCLAPGAVDELFNASERWRAAASLGPLILTVEGKVYPSARRLPSLRNGIGHALLGWIWPSNPWTAEYRREVGAIAERPVEWLSGSCLLIRRAAFDAVGGFDPSYFMYFEDTDLGERFGRAGWDNVYVPSATAVHLGGHSTSRNRAAMITEHHRSAYKYLSRRYSGWRLWPLRVVLRVGLGARSTVARRVSAVAAGAEPQRPVESVEQIEAVLVAPGYGGLTVAEPQ